MGAQPRSTGRTDEAALDPRVVRSRAAIVTAALEHFLRNGYLGANVDDIAAAARVSKRTVYNIFGGKEQLFREIMADAFAVAEQFANDLTRTLADTDDVAAELRAIAGGLLRAVLSDRVLRLRRLLIGEAERFPELAREYYERAPGRVMGALTEAMDQLGRRGLLTIDDPRLAAEHFAYLVLGAPLDRALLVSAEHVPPEVEEQALAGVDVFLRAYAPRRQRRR